MAISVPIKTNYIRRQKILQNRLMNKHLQPVFTSLMQDNRHWSSMVITHGPDYTLSQTQHLHLNHTIGKVIENLYKDAAAQAYPRTKITKGALIPIFGFVRNVLQYFRDNILSKVVLPISDTTKKRVEKVLRQAIQEGWGVNKTVDAIDDPALTKRRAKMIVRTESVRAMNYSQLTAADNEKYQTEKTWIAVEDSRTRITHTHAGVDGETRDLYDEFSNGLLFPGDPNGPAEETINCRCTLGYQLKRGLNGRPVPKRPEDWAAEDQFRAVEQQYLLNPNTN